MLINGCGNKTPPSTTEYECRGFINQKVDSAVTKQKTLDSILYVSRLSLLKTQILSLNRERNFEREKNTRYIKSAWSDIRKELMSKNPEEVRAIAREMEN